MQKKHGSAGQAELILQSCPEENGAAALAMILSWYGRPAPIGELTSRPLNSAADLVEAARSKGIYAQGYRMTFDQLRHAPMPLIAHWRFRSFVVVTGIREGKVCVNSPEEGRQLLSRHAFERGFTGVAVCFATDGEEKILPKDLVSGGRKPAGGLVWPILVAAQLFLAAGYVVLTILFRSIATQLSSAQTGRELSLCLLLGLVLVLQLGASAFQAWLLHRSAAVQRAEEVRMLEERLAQESSASLARTDLFYLNEAARGCVRGPASRMRRSLCVAQLVSGAVCLLIMAAQNPIAAAVSLLVAATFGAICLARCEKLYSDARLRSRSEFLVEDRVARDLTCWAESRLRGENQDRFRFWAGEAGGAFRPQEAERQKAGWYIAAAGELLLVLGVCLLGMIGGTAGTEDLLGCMALAAALAASLGALPGLFDAVTQQRVCREDWSLVFQHMPETIALSGAGTAETITVQNVTLRIAQKETIRDISFTVRRGEILVVLGEAEVRKALLAALSGMERLSQGEIYLDKRNAAELNDRDIFREIAFLGGGIPFPEGTVRENIAAGLPEITDYAVMEAASDALLHNAVLLREQGYDTPVSTLSSGERILLEFARAFACGTPFLVCDGLTGQLDETAEDQLIRNMRRRGVGAVLLTEDATLLRKGDLVCRIENGRPALRERTELVGEGAYSLV